MPLTNIIDERDRRYRFNKVLAIVEPTWHDCGLPEADQVDKDTVKREVDGERLVYADRGNLSVADAIKWADSFESHVTLFLYNVIDPQYAERKVIRRGFVSHDFEVEAPA
jgi:hypothetical protein